MEDFSIHHYTSYGAQGPVPNNEEKTIEKPVGGDNTINEFPI